jgi:hypothetical protein
MTMAVVGLVMQRRLRRSLLQFESIIPQLSFDLIRKTEKGIKMNVGTSITALKLIGGRSAHRGLLLVKKYSPEILTATGIIGGVVAAVLGAKATLELEEVVDHTRARLEIANELKCSDSNSDHVKNLVDVYSKATLDIVKLYGPAVSLGVASIGCILGAHGIMHKRNAALTAAYVALDKGFNEYRKRVQDALGEEMERNVRFGQVEEVVNGDNGEPLRVETFDPNAVSVYARFFDEVSPSWQKEPDYNLLFLKCQQNYANDLLRARGHLFLNEVYDMLGLERSSAGQVVGWVLSRTGDNFVDFGIYRGESEAVREFVNGREVSILLDFNVDGVVFDKI